MLTSLEIENFKGIAGRQRIDFAPLTLLFGANSAGKSTILQALLYLHELIERGSADVDRTDLGGNVLELGGFARLVHRHDTARAIVLRAEFATPGGLERFGRDLNDFPFPDLDDQVESAWLDLTVRFRTTPMFRGPIVERAVIGVNGDPAPLVWLELGASLRDGEPAVARVNLGHPVLHRAESYVEDDWGLIAIPQSGQRTLFDEPPVLPAVPAEYSQPEFVPVFAISRSRLSALPSVGSPLRVLQPSGETPTAREAQIAEEVRTFLEMVVLGTTAQLGSILTDALYVGPLRTIPPRGFLYERRGRGASWADGLAAWERLLADRVALVEQTNHWLDHIGAGCRVTVQELFDRGAEAEEISGGHVDKTVRRLLLDTENGSRVLPSEVGAGISQIVPVIVAALDAGSRLSIVEQPELHVHPAIQVGLGDLFIDAASRDGFRKMMIVETHSEHLILRVLRRIRQTSEGELPEGARAFSADKLSVIYVESGDEGSRTRALRVDELGEFKDRWPKGFFAERMAELL